MTRRDMALQGTLAFGLIVGIVGGNFVLHRWVLGNAASREADAGTTSTDLATEDLSEFAPTRRATAQVIDPAVQLERLRQLIARKLPDSSEEERQAWLEELSDSSLTAAEGILDLRGELQKLKAHDETSSKIDWSRVSNGGIPITR